MCALILSKSLLHTRTHAHARTVWVIMHIFVGTPQRDLGNMSCIFENVQCCFPVWVCACGHMLKQINNFQKKKYMLQMCGHILKQINNFQK